MVKIDINCDMGESYGNFKVGNDEAIFPYISSCNIACGFHGGDPFHMQKTIKSALKYNVKIGAHPSYPDLAGFGRRKMDMNDEELKAVLKYQIAAIKGMVESEGGQLEYVKPHGALYNASASDVNECQMIVEAVKEIDSNLALMGLANSRVKKEANANGLDFIAEAFADRRYLPSGQLMSRKQKGSVITKPEEAFEQVKSLVMNQSVTADGGNHIAIKADSICIHGDNPSAVETLKLIKDFYRNFK